MPPVLLGAARRDRVASGRGAVAVVLGLVLTLWASWAHASPIDPPAAPAAGSTALQVSSARVWLTVYRPGERRPSGQRVSLRGSWVQGVVEYQLNRPAKAGERLVFVNFAESIPKDPRHLDEVTMASYLDGPYDSPKFTVDGAWGTKRVRKVGPRRDIEVAVAPGARTITLRYEVKVPHRYWPLGCVFRRCSLSGAIAPLPSAPARGGPWLPAGRVIRPVRWKVERAAFASVPGWTAGHEPTKAQREAMGRDDLFVVGGDGRLSQYPSVFWGRRWKITREVHRGVTLEVRHMNERTPDQVPHERKGQLYRDVVGNVLKIGRELVDLLAIVGRSLPADRKLVVVQGPLRSEVAQFHPDTVLVSDQSLEIFPVKRFLRFHEEAIARSMADAFVEREFRGRHDPSTAVWIPGTVSFAMLNLWRQRRAAPDEFANDILRNVTFFPAVDRFLYTQQAAFSQAYFRGSEDQMPLRNHPLYYGNELPSGRRIHEKLLDTLGPKGVAKFIRAMVANPGANPRKEAARAYGYELGWFFDQWLGPYPSVDYAIVDVKTTRTADGYDHTITIRKHGERAVVEPVQVLVTERGGKQHFLLWNGELPPTGPGLEGQPRDGTHVFELHTEKRIKNVRLDPRGRLVEEPQAPKDAVDPKFNNRDPAAFRFLYTGALISLAVSEFFNANTAAARFNALTGFIFFESSLRRDLRRTGTIQLFRNRETHVGAGAGANFWFGKKRNRQRRKSRFRIATSMAWLNARSLDPRGGLRVVETLALIHDTRKFFAWPEQGYQLGLSASARQTIRVADGEDDHRFDLTLGANWVHLWRLAHDHVLATSVGLGFVVPLKRDVEFRNQGRLGGIGGLAGYSADEIFGLGTALALVEYRHVFLNNIRGNLVHLAWLRSVGGAAFVGVGSASSCDDYGGWFGRDSWYSHVGYALTAYFQVLGVTPQLLRIDASVPLVRRRGVACLGQLLPNYLAEVQGLTDPDPLLPPFSINVTFIQPF